MKSYRDLNIYQQAHALAIKVHTMSLKLPKFELFEEGSQIRRSAKAVSTCIVEGYARRSYKLEFKKFLIYSQSECDETIEHLDILFETASLTNENEYKDLRACYIGLSKQINRYIKWVDGNWNEFEKEKPGNPET